MPSDTRHVHIQGVADLGTRARNPPSNGLQVGLKMVVGDLSQRLERFHLPCYRCCGRVTGELLLQHSKFRVQGIGLSPC